MNHSAFGDTGWPISHGFFFQRGEVVDAEGHEAANNANRDGPWQMFLLKDVLLGFHGGFYPWHSSGVDEENKGIIVSL